ncbi:TnpV protein [Allocoprobacillus halotolerans]|uniref:TnpV protein n=1 Tax=Allocoprobacillus halotolerans TaxID=2944914 RepID=UPI003F4955ED
MKEQEGITEKLKSENPLCWIGKMNNIRNRAEELINRELIFALLTITKNRNKIT